MRRRYIGRDHGRLGAWQQLCEGPVICLHPMSKNLTTPAVWKRPESGTWQQECGDGDSSNGRPYRDP
ncbi:unnamed protein product [Staurois parvus]|uniref:Uncharacterized protein n=1 Tax=Staurois parvus TaxID=386267 RepID=A0ABN9FZE8_9NEOB|nr:unnamed protein product [Staurois parvus]